MGSAAFESVRFGDAATIAESTELGRLTLDSDGVTVVVTKDGFPPNLSHNAVDLSDAVDEALAVRDAFVADPATAPKARRFDITDDLAGEGELGVVYEETNDLFKIETNLAAGPLVLSPGLAQGLSAGLTLIQSV